MKADAKTTDYKNAVHLLLKEKTPYFIAGFTLFFIAVTPIIPLFATNHVAPKKNAPTFPVDSSIQIYTVQPGDDLWKISEKIYGSGYNLFDIAAANKLQEPYALIENQILVIPKVKSKTPTQGDVTEKAASTKKISSYVVKPGDYLWLIAETIYGDGNQISRLIKANNLPYPYEVVEGQKLIVP